MNKWLARLCLATGALAATAGMASAAEVVKVGLIADFTGAFANWGSQFQQAVEAFQAVNGKTVKGPDGKEIEIQYVYRDNASAGPDKTKQLAEDLVLREKVKFLAGFDLSPHAMAVADIATQAKVPVIIMNAATSIITTKSPYIVRTSMTLPQITQPIALWAANNGIKKVYTVVADYGPGIDAEGAFTKAFKEKGGEIVGSVRTPLQNPDYAPFIQRVKDAKPDAIFLFLPAGEQGIAFMKGYKERGLAEAGIRLIATGDITDDGVLEAMGDPTIGLITSFHYSAAHDSPENKAFVKAYAEVNGTKLRPNFMAVGGYDGMAAIYEALKKTGGSTDAEKVIGAMKGLKLMSPRGPITIDPDTRDLIQTVYIRKVEKTPNGLYNIEFDRFGDQKDPGK